MTPTASGPGRGGSNAPARRESHRRPPAPPFRSHLIPRTGTGWVAVILFLALLALAEPPIVDTVANRIYPWLFGFPFLYSYLLMVYVALIGVLLWALRRGL